MHRGWHSRPFVIVDDGREIVEAANRALERLGRSQPPIWIQHSVAQRHLSDAFRTGSIPAAIIIRVHEHDDAPLVLLEWLRNQSAPLCFAQVLVVFDAEMDERKGALAVWMENAFRHILHLSERGFAEELSAAVEAHRRET